MGLNGRTCKRLGTFGGISNCFCCSNYGNKAVNVVEQPEKLKKYIVQDDKPRQKIWDSSSLSTFSACPRAYNLSNLLGYKLKLYAPVTGFG